MATEMDRADAVESSTAPVEELNEDGSNSIDEEKPLSEEEQLERLLLHDERSCIFETRVERAALCRDRGSAQFKLKNVPKAIEWYERALYHIEFDEGTWMFEFMDKHRDAVNEVRLPVYLNLAMCYLLEPTQDLAKVVENADEALKIDATNAKALYRGGKAHLLNGNLDGARKKLKLAAKHQPNDKNIREALQVLAEKTAEARAKEKETWGGRLLETKVVADESEESDAKNGAKAKDAKPEGRQQLDARGTSSPNWLVPLLVLVLAVVTGLVIMLQRKT